MHWAAKYIGLPWRLGSTDPEVGLDCWGLFRHVQGEHYGLKLPPVSLTTTNYHQVTSEFRLNDEYKNWKQVDKPRDGDAVMMRTSRYPNHIGIWIDDEGDAQGVLHTLKGIGAVFSTLRGLSQNGWQIHSYYRHESK